MSWAVIVYMSRKTLQRQLPLNPARPPWTPDPSARALALQQKTINGCAPGSRDELASPREAAPEGAVLLSPQTQKSKQALT